MILIEIQEKKKHHTETGVWSTVKLCAIEYKARKVGLIARGCAAENLFMKQWEAIESFWAEK